jgi:hypothetical protein
VKLYVGMDLNVVICLEYSSRLSVMELYVNYFQNARTAEIMSLC